MIHCRLFAEGDRERMIELAHQHQRERAPYLTFSRAHMNATLDRALESPNFTVFVAEDDDGVIGYLAAARVYYAACSGFYIEQQLFYVEPRKRGSRAAAKLFIGFVRWAELQQAEEIFANLWERKGGARWLQRFGFESAGQQVMRRRVGGPGNVE
jgi:N-acetylglutamate synthase-like GNAT family acetyltransferase